MITDLTVFIFTSVASFGLSSMAVKILPSTVCPRLECEMILHTQRIIFPSTITSHSTLARSCSSACSTGVGSWCTQHTSPKCLEPAPNFVRHTTVSRSAYISQLTGPSCCCSILLPLLPTPPLMPPSTTVAPLPLVHCCCSTTAGFPSHSLGLTA